jgi:hypothetical protein
VPDFLQHSVEIVAVSYQFWERHRFIPHGSQSCDHLWKPHSVGITGWHFIRAPLEAWNHVRELDCKPDFLAIVFGRHFLFHTSASNDFVTFFPIEDSFPLSALCIVG